VLALSSEAPGLQANCLELLGQLREIDLFGGRAVGGDHCALMDVSDDVVVADDADIACDFVLLSHDQVSFDNHDGNLPDGRSIKALSGKHQVCTVRESPWLEFFLRSTLEPEVRAFGPVEPAAQARNSPREHTRAALRYEDLAAA
jgi:hypothetical protein